MYITTTAGPATTETATTHRRTIDPWPWSQGMGYAQAVEVRGQHALYVSGQTAIDAQGQIVGVGDMAAQVVQALDNVAALLAEAGFRFADVVRYDVHTTDVDAYLAASGRWPSGSASDCRPAASSARWRGWPCRRC